MLDKLNITSFLLLLEQYEKTDTNHGKKNSFP